MEIQGSFDLYENIIPGVTNVTGLSGSTGMGGVFVAGGDVGKVLHETLSSIIGLDRNFYLKQLEAICTTQATAAGAWYLLGGAGSSVRLRLAQPLSNAAVGTRYIWNFPIALKSFSPGNNPFRISADVNIGIWFFIVNGFMA